MSLFLVIASLTFLWSPPDYNQLSGLEGTVVESEKKRFRKRETQYRVISIKTKNNTQAVRIPIIRPFRKIVVGDHVSVKGMSYFFRPDIYQVWELKVDESLVVRFDEFVEAENENLKRGRLMCYLLAFIGAPLLSIFLAFRDRNG